MLTFFLPRRLRLGAALGRGSALRCGRGEMKRMTVANSELGAGNERERPGDCFEGGESVDGRMERDGEEGGGVGTRERSVLASPTLIKRNFTSHSDARPPDVEKKKTGQRKKDLHPAVFYASSCLKSQRASPRPSLTQNLKIISMLS